MSAPTTALDAPRVGATVLDALSVLSAMDGKAKDGRDR